MSVGDDANNLAKNKKIKIKDTTEMKFLNRGSKPLQFRNIRCKDRNGNEKVKYFVSPTKTSSSNGEIGAGSLPPKRSDFWYSETSGAHYGDSTVFLSIGRTDRNQISNIKFYYNRFGFLNPKNFLWMDSEINQF